MFGVKAPCVSLLNVETHLIASLQVSVVFLVKNSSYIKSDDESTDYPCSGKYKKEQIPLIGVDVWVTGWMSVFFSIFTHNAYINTRPCLFFIIRLCNNWYAFLLYVFLCK